MAVENHIDAVVFKQLRDRAHLAVDNRCISRRESGLVENNDLPELLAGIQIVDHPLPERGGISHEGRRRRVESISTRQIVIEEMGICVEEENVRAAVVE